MYFSISDVGSFPFPTSPVKSSLHQASLLLTNLGALVTANPKKKSVLNMIDTVPRLDKKRITTITKMGSLIAKFPLHPRLSKILVIARQTGLLTPALYLVAVLSEKSPFQLGVEGGSSTGKEGLDGKDDYVDSDDDGEGRWWVVLYIVFMLC